MGHGLCGGCAAALTGQFDDAEPGEGHFIADWVRMLDDARDKVSHAHSTSSDREAFLEMELRSGEGQPRQPAHVSVDRGARERPGSLKLHGCHFSIAEGRL